MFGLSRFLPRRSWLTWGWLLAPLFLPQPGNGDETDGAWPPELFTAEVRQLNPQEAFTFDPAQQPSGRITYVLTGPAFVRIRVVRRQDVAFVLRTLLDWTWQPAGPQQVEWDGRDAADQRVPNPATECFILCEANSPFHAPHAPERCHDLRLTLSCDAAGDPPLHGLTIFRISLDPGPTSYFSSARITLRFFLDGKKLHEVRYPPGIQGPGVIALDTATFPDGPHRFGVAVLDGFDHRAAASLEVVFANGNEQKLPPLGRGD